MTKKVKPIPEGYHSITPYLIIKDASKAIELYKKVFGAKELFRMNGPDGRIGHAELMIGDSHIMLADEMMEMEAQSPKSIGGTPVSFVLYLADVDAVAKKAVAEGMIEKRPVKDQFYGDRMGTFQDPFGHVWSIATHIEDVSPEELDKRAKAAFETNKECS